MKNRTKRFAWPKIIPETEGLPVDFNFLRMHLNMVSVKLVNVNIHNQMVICLRINSVLFFGNNVQEIEFKVNGDLDATLKLGM